jgi:glyceraldehyde-3-phosphate dehydrogenase (NAD(P))
MLQESIFQEGRIMVKVGVVGFGVIGQRLADGVSSSKGYGACRCIDVSPTLSIRALKEVNEV